MISQSLRTQRAVQAIDITDLVYQGVTDRGLYLASCPHSTAAVLLMESDEDLLVDLEQLAVRISNELGPLRHRKNDNPNGAAHLMSAIFGTQLVLCVEDEKPVLGAYQRVVFLELDGPRERHVELRKLS